MKRLSAKAPPPNRRPRFPIGGLREVEYLVCAQSAALAVVGEPVQGFVSDPNMVDGSTNHKNVKIDTSAANAAPAAIYQYERYGRDYAYVYEVPKSDRYTVRLHFAEIFNDGEGSRIEDIRLNDQLVLKDFDIFKAAGGMNKAVVKEFKDVAANDQGNIVIRITAASHSPDKNAKICGIEVLKAE